MKPFHMLKSMIPAFMDHARRMVEQAAKADIETAELKLAKARGRAA